MLGHQMYIYVYVYVRPISSNMETGDGPNGQRDQPGSRTARVRVELTLFLLPVNGISHG